MNNAELLNRNMSMGRLTWVHVPEGKQAVGFAKDLLVSAGMKKTELVYISAEKFTLYAKLDFISILQPETRLLLVGEFDQLDSSALTAFYEQVSRYKQYKYRYAISLVLLSSKSPDMLLWNMPVLKPLWPLSGITVLPRSADQLIHEWIEGAANRYGKRILSLNAEAADFFERTLVEQGEFAARQVIDEAVKNERGGKLCKKRVKVMVN